ncbi:tRNA preQ1(34) S-adenosylmethionine ribosyltransferase-isomerase QueA [Gymnodinialimonas ceratoperidinii]|uniref:S-adenosylmethionine:tRNA ribosyltransferase-isomerase n=1 Tax=Gymnodinialimonas ceratoperidinii TaxID=2856823 RepID=A0A8F6Y9G8_9RHOB|nr:tRNA preQ1(34) S-adenosylmethionine ribosyltransferase-isomerase QueA [Gymnodinialimonas ceratoperidinii]QXT38543.1 tRNA preQ1(34) S-adenosylmethionine ribosyltransferase-isomerase QueA [Gymnodinialimonas ceratoperidinii]
MKLDDFDFDLPEALIATRPARPRSAAKLLVADGAETRDLTVADLPSQLRAGDRLVLNDTRVIPARLTGTRTRMSAQGEVTAKIEVTLMEPQADGTWAALAKPMRKLKVGENINFSDSLQAEVKAMDEGLRLAFNVTGDAFETALNAAGAMPLPPYIAAKRAPDARDHEDYQTIWAKRAGAVAAPTASLHFDEALMAALTARGVDISFVTLHVGAGTFLPVTVEDVTRHKMHAEWGSVSAEAAAQINATKAAGGRIIPVGTTALRLIESAAQHGTIHPFEGTTEIFIYPGYAWQITDALMTNFHLPKSTLLMLVSALMGKARMDEVYAYAIAQQYRFFSYGDASLLIPSQTDQTQDARPS